MLSQWDETEFLWRLKISHQPEWSDNRLGHNVVEHEIKQIRSLEIMET